MDEREAEKTDLTMAAELTLALLAQPGIAPARQAELEMRLERIRRRLQVLGAELPKYLAALPGVGRRT